MLRRPSRCLSLGPSLQHILLETLLSRPGFGRLPPAPAAPLLAIAVLPVRHILLLVSLSSHDLPFLVITSGARSCFSSWLPARHALRQARQEVPRHRPARLNP